MFPSFGPAPLPSGSVVFVAAGQRVAESEKSSDYADS
jgi:hypothetical protein